MQVTEISLVPQFKSYRERTLTVSVYLFVKFTHSFNRGYRSLRLKSSVISRRPGADGDVESGEGHRG